MLVIQRLCGKTSSLVLSGVQTRKGVRVLCASLSTWLAHHRDALPKIKLNLEMT